MMSEKVIENNRVSVTGEIVPDFTFSHTVRGEGFYMMYMTVNRLSDQVDVIPLMISERLINVKTDCLGRTARVTGQFRSYNQYEEGKSRLILSVFVKEIEFMESFTDHTKNNQIFLDGYICKQPIYRKTPFGREITDLLVAVNRPYGESDYIPCIAWGRNARYASNFSVGGRIRIWGRIQSREYTKKLGEEESETRVAYEVSASGLEEVSSGSDSLAEVITQAVLQRLGAEDKGC